MTAMEVLAGPPPFLQAACSAHNFAKQMLSAGLLEVLSPTPASLS